MLKKTRGSREEDAWLSDSQLARCARADEARIFQSPIPTRIVSNGEYMPPPQSEKQKRVEARIQQLADSAGKRLGITRRQFLLGSGGMAAAFLALNETFGRFFEVNPAELFSSEAFAAAGAPPNLFVMDDQLHMVRSSMAGPQVLRAWAQGPTSGFGSNPFNPGGDPDELGSPWTPWNPDLVGVPIDPENFHVIRFIKDVFLDSQLSVGVLSNNTAFIPDFNPGLPIPKSVGEAQENEILTALQTVAVRNFVNRIAGSTRLLAHGLLYPGIGNLEFMQFQIDEYKPDSWKGYTISPAAKVDLDRESEMRAWRLDDEAVAYPTYELISRHQKRLGALRPGFGNICIHKGLMPIPPDTPERGNPDDIPKAARDWPNLNFIIYHSALRPLYLSDTLQDILGSVLRNGVPDIQWTTQFAQLAEDLPNVYAEIGTTFASSVITFPTVAAHVLGQLMKYLGPHRIVFGTDSVYYGSPQWQIEAFWRFEIPESIRRQYGYPPLTKDDKRRILGLNSARLYRLPSASERSPHGVYRPVPADYAALIPNELKTVLNFPDFAADNLSKMKAGYLATGSTPSLARFGWIRT